MATEETAVRRRKAPTRDERKAQTREELIAAANRLFSSAGFHAISVDAVADEAGYTKGAVYSNFDSKESLFFAVYERRGERIIAEIEKLTADLGPAEALHKLARDTSTRDGREDGWLAVLFEFWAHVLRHPELRERFAALRARSRRPLQEALEAAIAEAGEADGLDFTMITAAMNAAQLGLALERLTDPSLVDPGFGEELSRLALDQLAAHVKERSPR
jgi:AcrR family transcriptional regulator